MRATNVADVHVLAQDMIHHSERRRLLVFCDNRQDAAFQAGWMKDHARRFRLRALMAQGLAAGPVSVGDLALFIQLLPRITSVLTFVGDIVAQHRRVKVATDRMEHLLVDAPPGTIVEPKPLQLSGPMAAHRPNARPRERRTISTTCCAAARPNSRERGSGMRGGR